MFEKTINLSWKGQDYSVPATMELIETVDNKLNLMVIIEEVQRPKPRMTFMSKLISVLLNEAGANVSQEEVFAGMFGQGGVSGVVVMAMVNQIVNALFPTDEEEEPKKKKPKRKPTRKPK